MRRVASLGLVAILLFDVWWRCHTIGPTVRDLTGLKLWPVVGARSEPLDCDEAAYGYIGRRLVRGDVLYRDVTDVKPPVGYWIYALGVALGGASELTIRLVPLPFVLATLALVWWIGLRLGGPLAALGASGIAAVATTDPYLFGNGANLEHAMSFFGVASLALMMRGWDRRGRAEFTAAGVCVGLECLIKQVAFTHVLVYAAALAMRPAPAAGGRKPAGSRLGDALALTAGFALALGAAALTLAAQGALGQACEDVIRYGATMAAETPPQPSAPPGWMRWLTGNADAKGELPWPFGSAKDQVWWGRGTWPVWLASAPALAWLWRTGLLGPRRLVVAWTLSAWVQVVLPGLFWPHYYLLPVPGLAIACAVLFRDLVTPAPGASQGGRRTALLRLLGACALAAALLGTAAIQVRDYLLIAPEEIAGRYKGGRQWVILRLLGGELARRATLWHDPKMYVWGWHSPLLFYSGLDSVARHFFEDPFLQAYASTRHPLARREVEEIMRELRARPPEIMFIGEATFPELQEFVVQRYHRSRLIGGGVVVEKGKFAQFEAFGRK